MDKAPKAFITPVDENTVRFLGRVLPDFYEGSTCFAYASSGIEFKFSGTSLSMEIFTSSPTEKYSDMRRVAVFIDNMDEAVKTVSLGESRAWYDIADNLPDTEHTVKAVRISEFGASYCSVSNIKTDRDTVAPTERKKLLFEFVGDSISAGHGNEGNNDIPFSHSVSNSEKTYCAYTAKAFDADYNIIAKSGISLEFGYGGYKGEMPSLYKYRDYFNGGKTDNTWDFEKYAPDIIIVNLGTNDYWAGIHNKDDADERRKTFTASYVDFLSEIRKRNPRSEIIAGLGPMTYELFPEIEKAVELLIEKGDKKIHSLKLEPQDPEESDSTGTEWHPSVATNLKMSKTLTEGIKRLVLSIK